VKASIQIPNFTWPGGTEAIGPTLARIGRAAEGAGLDTVWVMDHFFQLDGWLGGPEDPMLEAYSALSYLAAVTERVRLGTLVTGVSYRAAGHLAKTVTTLDVLSGGRAWLGIGAGWNEREARGLGLPFPPTADRFEQLEETLQALLRMWAGDRTPFEGTHVRFAEPILSPAALSQPHPPIMIGGSGEQKTLRLVAAYADACNFFAAIGDEELAHKLDVLKMRCAEVGRDDAEISKTVYVRADPANETHADIVERCAALAKLGFDHVIFNIPNDFEIEPIEVLGRDVLPALAEL
jgi:F420-dependent oxidoreductase-like protein